MRNLLRITAVALLLCLGAAVSPAAAEDAPVTETAPMKFLQGIVTGYTGSDLIVNEHWRVTITDETTFYNSRGVKTGTRVVPRKSWIYLEGILSSENRITAYKVYRLPGHIGKNARRQYPYMQLP